MKGAARFDCLQTGIVQWRSYSTAQIIERLSRPCGPAVRCSGRAAGSRSPRSRLSVRPEQSAQRAPSGPAAPVPHAHVRARVRYGEHVRRESAALR